MESCFTKPSSRDLLLPPICFSSRLLRSSYVFIFLFKKKKFPFLKYFNPPLSLCDIHFHSFRFFCCCKVRTSRDSVKPQPLKREHTSDFGVCVCPVHGVLIRSDRSETKISVIFLPNSFNKTQRSVIRTRSSRSFS